jgi:quinol monooxygenase YgiN
MKEAKTSPSRRALIAFGAAIVLAQGVSALQAQAPGVPTVQELIAPIQAAVTDPNKPFDLFIDLKIKSGMEEAFERAFAPAVAATRHEPGNLDFTLTRHPTERGRYMLHERWVRLADVESHMGTPHMQAFWPIFLPMVERPPAIQTYMTAELPGAGDSSVRR